MKSLLKKNKDYIFGGLYGSSGSYIAKAIYDDYKNTIILLNNNSEIYNLAEELKLFFSDNQSINMYIDYESLPYEKIITDNEINSERIKTYKNIINNDKNVILTTYASIIKRIIPLEDLEKNYFDITVKSTYKDVISIIESSGYQRCNQVYSKGEFSIRGPIIDIFTMTANKPIRIVFDHDKPIIKEFDIDTQKSTKLIKSFIISNTHEIKLTDKLIDNYKKLAANIFDDEYFNDIEFEKISNKIHCPTINNILPLLYESTSLFLEMFDPDESIVLTSKPIMPQINKIKDDYDIYYDKLNSQKFILSPKYLLSDENTIKNILNNITTIELSSFKSDEINSINATIQKLPSIIINNTYKDPYINLKKFIQSNTKKILFCIQRKTLRNELSKILDQIEVKYIEVDNYDGFVSNKYQYQICDKRISEGFIDYKKNIVLIADRDIFGPRAIAIPKKQVKKNLIDDYINDISALEIDSPIVHDNYGVGRYKGLINMDVEGINTELIKIEYADKDILYIPVFSINLLKKYAGHTGLNVPLHNLGTDHWIKIKTRAKNKINDIAVQLLENESKRLSQKGFTFENNANEYYKFAKKFPFIETEDQAKTINEVINDMTSDKSMDRLICGDVGFGKTEIIMRAAFVAAQNSKQTIILAPTTLLVEQHYKSFCARFDETAINIGKFSRLQSTKEKNITKDHLKSGKIDILIGTHALLSKSILFKDIGLFVIDEEHKFGVADKEKIKVLKSNIDVITLTATPIPRTLNSALSQIRDLSVIETPPTNRKPIITRVISWDKSIIGDAIAREIQRGGQIYYVHNDIKTMDNQIKILLELNKELKIGIIHGQLDNKIIENKMDGFLNQRYDLLMCTSIIESGLDIQNVNTIIINNSNKFGLSQLHQIRGRVGRTNRQAYAYLITPDKSSMTKDAEKRLEAIDSVNSLGGGLELATHDLEIRGAGELLGEEQSGQIYEVGYAMFTEMLNRSIEYLKNGKNMSHESTIEIDIQVSCLIPQDYINDIFTRLIYYRKISSCENIDQLNEIQDEMTDIFGPITEYLENLFEITALKIKINNKNIKMIKIFKSYVRFEYLDKEKINIDKLVINISNKDKIKILKNGMMEFQIDDLDIKSKCNIISDTIKSIA